MYLDNMIVGAIVIFVKSTSHAKCSFEACISRKQISIFYI